MCVHRVCALYLRRSEKGVRFPGTGVVLGYKRHVVLEIKHRSPAITICAFNH